MNLQDSRDINRIREETVAKKIGEILEEWAYRGSTRIVKHITIFVTELLLAIVSFLGFIIGAFSNQQPQPKETGNYSRED